MNNPMMNTFMNMLKARNPQGYAKVNQAMQMGTQPQALVKQFMSEATPEQKEAVIQQATQMGVPKEILKQIQDMK